MLGMWVWLAKRDKLYPIHCSAIYFSQTLTNDTFRDNFVNAPSQWDMTLYCNVVSHWLGAYTKWSLHLMVVPLIVRYGAYVVSLICVLHCVAVFSIILEWIEMSPTVFQIKCVNANLCWFMFIENMIYEECCTRSRYQGQGQIITSYNICGM